MSQAENQVPCKSEELPILSPTSKDQPFKYGLTHLIVGTVGVITGASITPIFGLFPEVDT